MSLKVNNNYSAWINWDEHPLTDSRFRKFGSGDTYCYYPGNRSSVRFERLIEGIHQYEKVQILKEEYKDNAEKMRILNTLLKSFESHAVAGVDCADKVNRIEAFLNGQEVEIEEPEDLQTGYYHIISKATSRTEHIYNDALLNGNSMMFTLQSNTKVTTNNGIWHITLKDNNKIGVKNGDGHPMVAGASWGGSVVGTFNELTINDIVKVTFTNRLYISRAISQFTGRNFCQFVNYYRVQHSIQIFRENPDLKVAEMAMYSGFNSTVSFSMAFRLYMSECPSDWCRKEKLKLNRRKK